MQKSNQKVFRFKKSHVTCHNEPSNNRDYTVLKISKELFENTNHSLENIGFLRSKLLEFWSSPESFFQKGIGYYMVYRNNIVSLCFSGFVAVIPRWSKDE